MQFSQHIVVHADDEGALVRLLRDWDESEGDTAPGFIGARLLRFRDEPGKYVVAVDFDSWEAAQKNNDRPETQAWAEQFRAALTGEPHYENLDVMIDLRS